MAERNSITPDSISTLIYVDMRGETGGYRTDLLKEQVSENMRKFIFCSKCDGISIQPQVSEGKTFCTNCVEGRGGEVDGRIDGFVRELKCRCPLSIRGCDWSGKLHNIEEHMNGCVKSKIKCQIGCGKVLQKCDTIDHQKECPFRIQECEYCKEDVRANKANEHIRLCQHHPYGVVTCPYMENMISHQKLLLRDLNQLRTGNQQLRTGNQQLRTENKQLSDKIGKKEFETNKQTNLFRNDTNNNRSIWILLTLVIMGIAILIPLLLMERDRIHQNELSIQSTIQSIMSNGQSMQSNGQSIRSTKQSIGSNGQSITCPYKEVGFETIGILRKDLETHITQNAISHQKLVREFNQLRTGLEQLGSENTKLRTGIEYPGNENIQLRTGMEQLRSENIHLSEKRDMKKFETQAL
ncbi:hypothetical protein LOD99_11444 [Oopsacas minuta]|uniref:TRAF-type domain-containing protein n=1 Tax=Oopsacas minuta TaxID=111878 RepID=A0AAV7K1F4_9METZ|nr:hypothetical protein LOD99_11444 [Oopsacas minuta]